MNPSPAIRAISIALVLFAVVAVGAAVVEALGVLELGAPVDVPGSTAALPGAAVGTEPEVGDAPADGVRAAALPPGRRVRVQVLNGSGQPGLARRATGHLRAAGFDVVHFGNAREFGRDTTAVIDRVGEPALAEAVAAALGVPVELRSEPDPTLELEVTVVLGRNWPPAEAGPRGDSARVNPVVRLWRRLRVGGMRPRRRSSRSRRAPRVPPPRPA